MTKNGTYEEMFKHINSQLEEQAIIIKQGALVDASIIDIPLKPKGKPIYRVAGSREGDKNSTHEVARNRESKEVEKQVSSSVDPDGAWIRKAEKLKNNRSNQLQSRAYIWDAGGLEEQSRAIAG